MEHHFDIDIAKNYGVDEAILLHNLNFWVQKNKANKKHFYDNDYWTYNSIEAFTELFPYWTKRQIERIIISLVDKGLIKKGNYNKSTYDRTTWYAFTELSKSFYSIGEIHFTKNVNGNTQTVVTIPDSNTDNKQDSESESHAQEIERLKKCKFYLDRKPNQQRVGFNSVDQYLSQYYNMSFTTLKMKYKNWAEILADFETRNIQKSWKDSEDLRSHVSNFFAKWQPIAKQQEKAPVHKILTGNEK